MVKVGENLLIAVKVTSIIESEKGISYEVSPLGRDRYFQSMKVIEGDIYSYRWQESEGGKKK